MEWLDDNLWLAWLAVALILGAIETITIDFVFLMMVGGALAGAIAAAFGLGILAQVLIAVIVALLLLFSIRPLIRRQLSSDSTDHQIGSKSVVGRIARVVVTVTEVDGRVKLDGETWSARTPDDDPPCEPGEEVRVLQIDGAHVIVTKDLNRAPQAPTTPPA